MQLLEGVNHCSEYVRKCLACIRDTLCFIICLCESEDSDCMLLFMYLQVSCSRFCPRTNIRHIRQSFTPPTSTSCSECFIQSVGTSESFVTWSDTHTCTQIFRSFDFPSFFHHRSLFFNQAALNFSKFCEPLAEGKGKA